MITRILKRALSQAVHKAFTYVTIVPVVEVGKELRAAKKQQTKKSSDN